MVEPVDRLVCGGIVVATLFATLAVPRRGKACSCAQVPLHRESLPADGAEGIPPGASIRVFLRGRYPDALVRRLAEEYRLHEVDGGAVALESKVTRDVLELSPESPLKPETRYRLERVYAYDGAGVRISDGERWRAARARANPSSRRSYLQTRDGPPEAVRRAWFPIRRFRTGSGSSSRTVADPTVVEADWSFAYGGGDCGPGVGLHLNYEPPDGLRPTDVVELEVRGRGTVEIEPAFRSGTADDEIGASDMLCNPDPVILEYGPKREVRVSIVDAAGRRIASSKWVVPEGRPGRSRGPNWMRRRRRAISGAPKDATEIAEQWGSFPFVDGSLSTPAGAVGCPHGFVSDALREISPPGGAGSHDALTAPVRRGGKEWLAINEGYSKRAVLTEVGSDGPPRWRELDDVSHAEAIAADESGYYVASVEFNRESRPSNSRLYAVDSDGTTRWSAELGPGWKGHTITVADGEVLVAWPREREVNDYRLAWHLYDATSGEQLARRTTARRIEQVVSTVVDGRFVLGSIEHHRDGRRVALSILEQGAEIRHRTLPLQTRNYLSIASHGPIVAVATPTRSQEIQVSFYDIRGRRLSPPVFASRGIGKLQSYEPRITWIETGPNLVANLGIGVAGGGGALEFLDLSPGYFAVAWESSDLLHATAVDLHGRHSRIATLHGGSDAYEPGIVDVARGIRVAHVGSYRRGYRVYVEHLHCRNSSAPGAPQRIAPLR